MENSTVVPQKIKNRITVWYSNSISGHIPKTELKAGTFIRECKRDSYTPCS